jgi:hypothetical protein
VAALPHAISTRRQTIRPGPFNTQSLGVKKGKNFRPC